MPLEVEATYENGVLKLDQPLPLEEHQRVKVLVNEKISRTQRTYGLVRWTGSQEALDYLIHDPENSPWET